MSSASYEKFQMIHAYIVGYSFLTYALISDLGFYCVSTLVL